MIRRLIVKFDNVAARIGKRDRYRRAFWWYKTQDTYFSTGLGKLFMPMQFTALAGNIGLILIVLEKIFSIPQWVYKYIFVFVGVLLFACIAIGRFMDKSNSFELENEWGMQRSPFAKEMRRKLKIKTKYAVKKKKY